MASRVTHVLGLDIGSDATKIVEVKLGRDGAELVSLPLVIKTPPQSVQGGVVVEPQAVGAALKEHLGQFGTKKCVCSVGGQSSLVVRISEMPKMSTSDLKEAIQWELERQTTFPPDQIIYDYAVIERPDAAEDSPNMEVLLAAAHEDLINAHVEALMAAGLQPVGIDIEALALSRSMVNVFGDQLSGQTVAIINVGSSLCDITIIRHGLVSFVRSIPTGGESVTRAISQAFVVDTDEAERIKRQYARLDGGLGGAYAPPAPVATGPDTGSLDLGTPAPPHPGLSGEDDTGASVFELSSADGSGSQTQIEPTGERVTHLELDESAAPPPPPGSAPPAPSLITTEASPVAASGDTAASQQVYDAVAPILGELTTELRRSLDFYRRQHRNEAIDRIIIAGGSAVIPGLTEFVVADLGIPTVVADPFAGLLQRDGAPAEYLRDVGPLCAIAVGLALRDLVTD